MLSHIASLSVSTITTKGPAGAKSTLVIGDVTVVAPDQNPAVIYGGTDTAGILNFNVPRAAQVTLGTVATGVPGTETLITNTGVNGDMVLNFTVPAGEGLVFKGYWAAGTYVKYDTVAHENRAYVCVVPSTIAVPGVDADWTLLFEGVDIEAFTALKNTTVANKEQTDLNLAATNADTVATAADRVQTGLDRVQTGADVVTTGQDKTQTGEDRVATGEDATATAADRVATGQDKVATGADRDQTGLDVIATAADRVATGEDRAQTNLDAIATAEDRVQTGADRTQTGLDRSAVAADLVLTDADTVATAADRVQTGLDVIAAEASKNYANKWATEAEDVPVDDGVNPVGYSAQHYMQKAITYGHVQNTDTILDEGGPNEITAAAIKTLNDTTIPAKANKLILETAEKTADYTLADGDQDKVVLMNKTGAATLTVPANDMIAFPVGTKIWVYNVSSDDVTVAGAGGVTVRGAGALARYGEVSLRKRATDEWVLAGVVLAPPTDVTAAVDGSDITITIGTEAALVDGYHYYQQIDGGAWTKINATATTDLTYTLTPTGPGEYNFRVTSVRGDKESAPSAETLLVLFYFAVNDTQTISGLFSTTGEITVHWGDGTSNVYNGTNQAWSKDYGSAVDELVVIEGADNLTKFEMNQSGADISFDLKDLPSGVTYFVCAGSNTVSGSLADLPSGLTYFYCIGSNTISGSLADLPSALRTFSCFGSNTISGSLADLPSGLAYFRCAGSNTISGSLADLPSGLTYFVCIGSNTISGSLADLPSGLTYFYCIGRNTIDTYVTKTWTTKPETFILIPVSPGGLSETEINQLLIDLDEDLDWSTGTITLTGTNAAPTGAGLTAIANMAAEGATITVNS